MKKKNKNLIAISLIAVIVIATIIIYISTKNKDMIIGGDKDEHGCLIGAGYSWCESKQTCLRTWESPCPESFCNQENVAEVYICGDYVRVVSSLLGGGSTFYRQNMTSFTCPVISQEYMTEECKDLVLGTGCVNQERVC